VSNQNPTKLDFILRSSTAHEIASTADFEIEKTYEENISHYISNEYSYIPLPYSESYYDIEAEELRTIEVMEHLVNQPFLIYDSYGKRMIDQPDEDSLPYRYDSGHIEIDGKYYSPRDIYNNYSGLKDVLPEHRHSLLLGLAQERHRYFIITLPDINKRATRTLCYQLLMQLETRLADRIISKYESEELFKDVNFRTLGRWKEDEVQGNKVHIAEHMGIGEIKKIIRKDGDMVEKLGFSSKSKFKDQLSGVVDLRNKVMHPTRTLVHDESGLETQVDRLLRIKDLLESLIELDQEISEPPYVDDIDIPE